VRTKEEITSHSNLDSSIYTLEMSDFLYNRNSEHVTFIDSSLHDSFALTRFSIDTTIKYGDLYCFVINQGFQLKDGQYGWGGFEGHLYGKGIGKIHYYYNYDDHSGPHIWIRDYLFYFKKANDSCGTPDYTSVQNPLAINELEVFPNPATAAIHININEIVEYSLTDINGKIVSKGSTLGLIDISGLTQGVYVLRVKVDNKIHIKKITKLNSQF
jgi:hypothetical protein